MGARSMKKEYLIREKPLKALVIFALPMMLGNLFQQFYNMADSVVVGQYVSEQALAAVGASYALTTVFISIAIGGGMGASVMAGLYFGAREYGKLRASVRTALLTFLLLSIVLGMIGFICSRQLMLLLNTPEDVLDQATEYLNIYFMGLPFLFMYNVLSALFNALGRSRTPLFLLIFSSVFNIGLDIYLVCRLELGVAGVAWATLIAQGISAVAAFLLFLREMKKYRTETACSWFDRKESLRMTRVALPAILQQSTVSIGMLLVQSVVNSFGAEMLAGYSAGSRIESLCIVPMAAMGNAISAFTAQNIGARQYARVKQGYHAAYGIVFGFAVLIGLTLELFYRPLIFLFLGEEGTLLAAQTGGDYLRFLGWFFALIGLKMITDGLLRGSGDMKMFTIANLVNLGIRVLAAFILTPVFGISMVWVAVPVGWLANYLISFAEYRTGAWRKAGEKKLAA